jgi:hypothetical protein
MFFRNLMAVIIRVDHLTNSMEQSPSEADGHSGS